MKRREKEAKVIIPSYNDVVSMLKRRYKKVKVKSKMHRVADKYPAISCC